MSLINEVLRELESRRPDDLARQNLQREIRVLPPARRKQRLWLWLFGGGVVLVFAGAWFHLFATPKPQPIAEAVLAEKPSLPPPSPEKLAAPSGDKLRLAFELSVPPLLREQPNMQALPPAPHSPVQVPVVTAVVTPVAPSATLPKNESERMVSGAVRIDKSPVLATPRDQAEMELRKAEQAMAGGRIPEAIEAWQSALRFDPAFITPRQALVAQLLAQRRLTEVAKLLEEGLSLQPGQTQWAMTLARVQLELGALNKADETLARFQNQALHLPEYAGFQGHLKSRLGAHAEAISHYSRAVRMAPNEGRWWLGLGLELQADGKTSDAKEAFRRALATSTLSAELAAVAQQQIQN